jgi:hypothetical protein
VTFSKVTRAGEPGTFTKGNEVNEEREWPANGPASARKLRQGRRELTRKESFFDQADRLERRFDFSVEIFISVVVYAFLLRLSLPGC